jgi:ribosomal protein S12 methylthiotransferase accessory factor
MGWPQRSGYDAVGKAAISQDGRMLEPRLVNRNVKPAAAASDVRLLQLAGRADELFQLGSPYAPGLVYVGGMARLDRLLDAPGAAVPLSGGGSGLDLAAALGGCLGEIVEYACQFPAAGAEPPEVEHRALAAALSAGGHADALALWQAPDPTRRIPVMPAIELATGATVALPAALFLRGAAETLPVTAMRPLGSGIAAGRTRAEAEEHAVLELIERDAAARWWCFGRPGHALSDGRLGEGYRAVERALDRPAKLRRSWLLDISTHVPVVAALSCTEDGHALAVGLAARRSLGAAAVAALLEMCQMELSLALIHGRVRHRGEAALTAFERRHFERSRDLCVDGHEILLPLGAEREESPRLDTTMMPLALVLKQKGIAIYAADLTHPELGIPVIAARSPHLLPVPVDAASRDTLAALDHAPRGELFERGFMLL